MLLGKLILSHIAQFVNRYVKRTGGENLDFALARKRLGMTQAQIAEKIGVDQGSVSNWERGKGKPNVTLIPKVAEVYGVTVDFLLAPNPMNGKGTGEAAERSGTA